MHTFTAPALPATICSGKKSNKGIAGACHYWLTHSTPPPQPPHTILLQTDNALNNARASVASARSAFEAARQRVTDGVNRARAAVDAAVADFNRVSEAL